MWAGRAPWKVHRAGFFGGIFVNACSTYRIRTRARTVTLYVTGKAAWGEPFVLQFFIAFGAARVLPR